MNTIISKDSDSPIFNACPPPTLHMSCFEYDNVKIYDEITDNQLIKKLFLKVNNFLFTISKSI